jgi:hypothetical protein
VVGNVLFYRGRKKARHRNIDADEGTHGRIVSATSSGTVMLDGYQLASNETGVYKK